MKISTLKQNTDAWFEERKGKITGSKLNDVVTMRGTGRKVGVYQLIADRLAIVEEEDDAMERGHRLEPEAIALFEAESGKTVERVGLCTHDKYDDIAISPDGLIKYADKYKEAVEVKCLKAALHLKAWLEKDWSDYKFQVYQYFIVNEDLKTLYMVFYDPRIASKPMHTITINRSDVEEETKTFFDYQVGVIEYVNEKLEELAF